jgi:putative transposase
VSRRRPPWISAHSRQIPAYPFDSAEFFYSPASRPLKPFLEMPGRRSLPHRPPLTIDSAREIWFVTICCASRGENQLTSPTVSEALMESVRYRWMQGHWHPHLFLLMPDHCHALISFPADRSIRRTISDWKHWTSTHHGIIWQRDFFDHRLRGDEAFSEKASYIDNNPVRAGLISTPDEWPFVWRAPGMVIGTR